MRIKIRPRGFTLVELLIVVAIIGILAAIVYPSYQDSVRKSRRADAKAVMAEAAQFMERFYTENFCYSNRRTAAGCAGAAVALPAPPASIPPRKALQSFTTSRWPTWRRRPLGWRRRRLACKAATSAERSP